MAEYIELLIHVPDDRYIPGQEARVLAARARQRALKTHDPRRRVPAAFFHKHADGTADSNVPLFRFGGGHGLVRLTALGEWAVDMLGDYGHHLTRALSDYYGVPLHEERRGGPVGIESGDSFAGWRDYHIPSLLIQRPSRISGREFLRGVQAGEVSEAEIRERIERYVRRGIIAQCDALCLDVDENFPIEVDRIVYKRMMPIHYVRHTYALGVTHVRLQAAMKLTGPWHVGSLRARGYGCMIPERRAVARHWRAESSKHAA